MTPIFQIIADGADVTGNISDRLISIEVIDEDGENADCVTIQVDNRDDLVELPAMDASLEIWLGYRETGLSMMGRFSVDRRGGDGPVQTLTIRATAADMKGAIRSPRTRAWENKTLGDIVRTIAGEAGLKGMVGPSIADTRWPFLAQTAESNLHFLRRIAAPLDATAKPAGGSLVVARRGEEQTAAGDAMPNGQITRTDLTAWSWSEEGRERAGKVTAEWSDMDSARRERVEVGDGDPELRLRHVFSSEDDARRACEGEVSRRRDGEVSLTCELGRFAPEIVAGARLTVSGVSAGVNGQWQVTRVTHNLSAGLLTSVEATRGGER